MPPVQLEFDFGGGKKVCDLPRFDAPKNDNERLLNMQYAYKVDGDRNALNDMYRVGLKVSLRYIAAIAKKNRHVRALCRSDKEEKAHNAIAYIIARLLKVEDFAVQKSFTAYLYLRIQYELFYQRKVDKIVDFVDWDSYRGAQ